MLPSLVVIKVLPRLVKNYPQKYPQEMLAALPRPFIVPDDLEQSHPEATPPYVCDATFKPAADAAAPR
jgi:hypothetical protein